MAKKLGQKNDARAFQVLSFCPRFFCLSCPWVATPSVGGLRAGRRVAAGLEVKVNADQEFLQRLIAFESFGELGHALNQLRRDGPLAIMGRGLSSFGASIRHGESFSGAVRSPFTRSALKEPHAKAPRRKDRFFPFFFAP